MLNNSACPDELTGRINAHANQRAVGTRRDAVDENEDVDNKVKSRDSFRLGLFCFAGNLILRLKFTRADHRGEVVGLTQ